MTNVKELYKKYMDNMPVDIKTKKDTNMYIDSFWKEQKEIVKEKCVLLKNEAYLLSKARMKWEANAKAEAKAEVKAIAQAKAEAKAEANAIAKVKAELKEIAKEISLDIAKAKAEAKEIAREKAEAKEMALLKAEWKAIFENHQKAKAAKAAKAVYQVWVNVDGGPTIISSCSDSAGKVKRNLHEYNLFVREQYYVIKDVKPELKNSEIMVEIAKLWNLQKLLAKNLASSNPYHPPVTIQTPTNPENKRNLDGPSWWWINKGEEIMLNRR
jgi:hypothetical protein